MSGTNRDTINYFPIYMRHCTGFQPNKEDHKVVSVATVYRWSECIDGTNALTEQMYRNSECIDGANV